MEDEKIIALFWSRSEQAIEEIAAKYGRLCRKIAGNILENEQDTEECLNDTYPVSYTHLDVYKRQFLRFPREAG